MPAAIASRGLPQAHGAPSMRTDPVDWGIAPNSAADELAAPRVRQAGDSDDLAGVGTS